MKNGSIVALVCAFILCGCGQKAPVPSEAQGELAAFASITELTSTQKAQRSMAVAAKEKLFTSLLGELTTAIQKDGVAPSIQVCKSKAPALAKQVSEELGVTIGRTSFQLRNDQNTPPDWAAAHVGERVADETHVGLDDGQLGVLLPIRLKQGCLKCHGASDSIATEVVAALDQHYPKDQATGFAEGDLRGYFWVEVPEPAK